MSKTCPKSCADRRRLGAASTGPAPATAIKPKPGVPADKSEHCAFWAKSGECTKNQQYMQAECATSCATAPEELEEQDVHQDCAAWVKDGECYRNPAFMLQQCKASCKRFAQANEGILQDTSDSCVNFALRGGCDSDARKAESECRASCHIQRICGNHSETVYCQKALRCEAIQDKSSDCASRVGRGECGSRPTSMLRDCLKSCSELDLDGLMHFHLPHKRTILSPLIDLPGTPPRLSGFYSTPPNARNTEPEARAQCSAETTKFGRNLAAVRRARRARAPWGPQHWSEWVLTPGRERTPRVPHLFSKTPAEPGVAGTHMVTVEQIAFSPRIRYIHRLLSREECEHVIKLAQPLFSRSPVRGSVTRVRTSTTAMLAGGAVNRDPIVRRIRNRIARYSGYAENLIEPLQVVRYQQGQKYDGHHDFFDVCDLEDKQQNGRRQVTFLIYLVDMPEGEDGGGTGFPELKIEAAPEQGSAIVFNDCFDNGAEDGRSLHAGLPPKNPSTVKMAINAWIRSHPVMHMNY